MSKVSIKIYKKNMSLYFQAIFRSGVLKFDLELVEDALCFVVVGSDLIEFYHFGLFCGTVSQLKLL